jgi:hypothetical protein
MRRPLVPLALILLAVAACGNPPDKELHQAQGAIDAARAAGAAEYAAAEFTAAQTSLNLANEAVRQRDYRLALSHALDAGRSAQSAAREAADQKALVRSEAERAIADLASAVSETEGRLKALRTARSAAAAVKAAEDTLADVSRVLQEARTAVSGEKYLEARDVLKGQVDRMARLKAALDTAAGPRRRR